MSGLSLLPLGIENLRQRRRASGATEPGRPAG